METRWPTVKGATLEGVVTVDVVVGGGGRGALGAGAGALELALEWALAWGGAAAGAFFEKNENSEPCFFDMIVAEGGDWLRAVTELV